MVNRNKGDTVDKDKEPSSDRQHIKWILSKVQHFLIQIPEAPGAVYQTNRKTTP